MELCATCRTHRVAADIADAIREPVAGASHGGDEEEELDDLEELPADLLIGDSVPIPLVNVKRDVPLDTDPGATDLPADGTTLDGTAIEKTPLPEPSPPPRERDQATAITAIPTGDEDPATANDALLEFAAQHPPAADPVVDAPRPSADEDFALTPRFVGREAVIGQLLALVRKSHDERRLHFAALIGAPGIGKTRLARKLATVIANQLPSARVLFGECGGPGAPPFAAYARALQARFRIDESDEVDLCRDKIARGVAEALPPSRAVEVTHLIAQLLGVPYLDSPVLEPLVDNSAQLEARTFIAVRRFLAADSEKSPLVLILDDVERASPETVNLTHYLGAGLESSPVALIAVGRPQLFEVHPSFGEGDAPLTRIELGPLSPEESEQLLVELVRPAGPPLEALLTHARDRMGGIPRAIFELIRYLLEVGAIRRRSDPGEAGHRWSFDPSHMKDLPSTLEEVLAARLRVMAPRERDLLERAATCGEAFWLDALVALVRAATVDATHIDGPSLEEIAKAGERTTIEVTEALARLEKRGLCVEQRHSTIPGEREYRFAFPPWWDVIYDRIDADARRRYHRLVAQWLELRPEGRDEDSQEEIGRHLERAGHGTGAAVRYRRAADKARSRYFDDKAVRLYTQALQCVGSADIAMRIQLWHDLGSVYQAKGDQESAQSAFERMLRLSWVVASRTKSAVAHNKLGRIWRQKGELGKALDDLERGLDLFQQMNDERGIAGSLDDLGQVLWLLGRYDEALDRSAESLERRRMIGDKRSVAVSLLNIGNIERHKGLFDEAASCYREALEIRRGFKDQPGIAQSLNALGMLSFQRGDAEGARREWEEGLNIAEEIGQLPLSAVLEGHLGEAARAQGQLAEARTRFERSQQLAREIDDRRLLADATRNLGLVALAHGENERALEMVTRAHELATVANVPVSVGRALLALGEVHAATLFDDAGSGGTAETYFRKGVDVFRGIRNEAELAVGLERFGRYWVERGDVAQGRGMLTEAQEIFARLGMKAGVALERMILDLG